MEKGLIIVKHPKQIVPESYLTNVLADGPVCCGIAVPTQGDKGPFLALEHMPDLADIAAPDQLLPKLMEIQKEMQEHLILFNFGKNPGTVSVANDTLETFDMQPFVLVDDDSGNIQLVGAMQGDYSKYVPSGGSHLPEYYLANNILVPKMKQLFRLCKGDLKTFMDELRDPVMTQELKNLCGDGVLTLLASNNDVLSFQKTEGALAVRPWGLTSNDYGDGATASETQEPAKKGGLSGLMGKVMGKASGKSVGKPIASTEPIKPTENKPVETKPTETKPVEEPKKIVEQPAVQQVKAEMHMSKNQKRDFYMKHAGYVPEGYKNCPVVDVKLPDTVKDFKDLGKVVEAKAGKADTATVVPASAGKGKDVAPKHVESKDTLPTTGKVTGIPIIPAEMKAAIAKDAPILKTLNHNGSEMLTPEQIKEIEAKAPSFFEQTGIQLEDTFWWNFSDFATFRKTYPEAYDVLLFSMRAAYMRLLNVNKAKQEEPVKTSVPTTGKSMGKKVA